jgi:hypothetical protein
LFDQSTGGSFKSVGTDQAAMAIRQKRMEEKRIFLLERERENERRTKRQNAEHLVTFRRVRETKEPVIESHGFQRVTDIVYRYRAVTLF